MGGTPKGLELVGGRRIIDRVADALREIASDIVLVANDPAATTWLPGVRLLRDHHMGAGGLAGIEAALTAGRDAVVVAWDMPFVNGDILRALDLAARTDDADLALPESDSPYGFEPFCAWYAARVRPALSAFLEAGGGAARDFIRTLPRVRLLSAADVARIGDARRLFFSVNSPEDLARARAMAASE
jgi:molybdopterin-guanine dinucleotide biosynthesis protein A